MARHHGRLPAPRRAVKIVARRPSLTLPNLATTDVAVIAALVFVFSFVSCCKAAAAAVASAAIITIATIIDSSWWGHDSGKAGKLGGMCTGHRESTRTIPPLER